ncbi:MAG: cytochrome C biogenesis protein [Deltaproteobacteria bacterium GWC2_42_51]|nr:MAG: cytochrome C biogenesis protein [Deltaproteobacteria bacterium GWB2_42_7]OGP32670.1 MAG: cytochrome C biogenesis protein [Deltaproteobacteria bacterium GWC2_42_51]OGP42240.1 MAG: cytochrome C biogenesis protein [Deltaproteobacteria bacterium GWD2_42_10]OGP46170.1 MAG: cytochrome C biogenesis protein [Deltaproteobacteria bacterium GWF2_42_12]OGQ24471.1 MAG: cytochrome C biogenesis protein [Deltaproteobacteria bacterium RIFCSPHIGHO2_02_FULL_42_44]OGQ36444.1 MAG: cytochrome C biogenesis p
MTQEVSIPIAFLFGLLSFISPCVLPLVPSYISFVTGISFEELTDDSDNKKLKKVILVNSLMFILGFSAVFVSLGASASFAGELLRTYQDIIRKVGGIVIVLLGIHIIGIINLRILQRDKRLHFFREKPAGILGSFLIGVGFAAGWTPCIGPILATILMIAASYDTLIKGVLLLIFYSLGLAIPFFLTSIGINTFLKHFNKLKKHMRVVSIATGSFLIFTGILIYFNYFAIFTAYLNSLFS